MSNAFKFDDVVDDKYTDYHRSRQSLFLPYCHGKKQKGRTQGQDLFDYDSEARSSKSCLMVWPSCNIWLMPRWASKHQHCKHKCTSATDSRNRLSLLCTPPRHRAARRRQSRHHSGHWRSQRTIAPFETRRSLSALPDSPIKIFRPLGLTCYERPLQDKKEAVCTARQPDIVKILLDGMAFLQHLVDASQGTKAPAWQTQMH